MTHFALHLCSSFDPCCSHLAQYICKRPEEVAIQLRFSSFRSDRILHSDDRRNFFIHKKLLCNIPQILKSCYLKKIELPRKLSFDFSLDNLDNIKLTKIFDEKVNKLFLKLNS